MTARRDFLRNLPGADFCPPEGTAADAGGLPPTADALARRTADTAEAVDEFAAAFWKMSPVDRRAGWEKLNARPADAPTAAFLKHLRTGLDVGPPAAPPGDAAVAELSQVARELFTLRPRGRAVRRLAWLDTRDRDVNWQDAVGRLWAADATTAELVPSLVAFLDEQTPPPTSADAAPPPRARRVPDREYYDDRRRYAPPAGTSGGSPWFGRLGIGGAVVMIIIIVRVVAACAGMGTKTSPNYSPSYTPGYNAPYSYTPPTFGLPTRPAFPTEKLPARDEPTYTFTEEEVRACRTHFVTRSGNPPPRYTLWLACGQPLADTPAKANAFKR